MTKKHHPQDRAERLALKRQKYAEKRKKEKFREKEGPHEEVLDIANYRG